MMLRYYQYQLPPTLGPVTMDRKEKKAPADVSHTSQCTADMLALALGMA